MITAGIDVGSASTKIVILNGERSFKLITPTGWSPREAGKTAYYNLLATSGYDSDQVDCIVGTGYGRVSLSFADHVMTEITCHGRGAAYLRPDCNMVIDIGGQDSKVIKIDASGRVKDFVMNDRCAAGTGRFLQVIAAAMGADVSELASLAAGYPPITLNSMCTVFAESEVTGLLASGKQIGEIVAGLHQAIAQRIANMATRLGVSDGVVFTGGVAMNEGVRQSIQKQLGIPVFVPEDCQFAGAIGAALIARDLDLRKQEGN